MRDKVIWVLRLIQMIVMIEIVVIESLLLVLYSSWWLHKNKMLFPNLVQR